MDTYTYDLDGKTEGPYPLKLIHQEVAAGRVSKSVMLTSIRTGAVISLKDASWDEEEQDEKTEVGHHDRLTRRLQIYGQVIFIMGWVLLGVSVLFSLYMSFAMESVMPLFSVTPYLSGAACFFMGLMLQGMAELVRKK